MEKIQIYLDTSIAERYFKKAVMQEKQNKQFLPPKIFSFFESHKEIQLFISSFTLAEIFEHLWKRYQVKPENISKLSNFFISRFEIIPILEFNIKPDILRWIRKYKLEAKDVIHLSIARSNKLFLLTDDDDLLDRGKAIYDKIISEENLSSFFISNHFTNNRPHHFPSFFISKFG